MSSRKIAPPALVIFLVFAFGCQGGARPTRLINEIDDVQVTEFQIRLLTSDYARRFSATVESASDEIVDRTDDPDIRRAALLWKTNAVGATQSVVLKPDPVAVLLDLWALTEQMARFLDAGPGDELFGEWQPIATEAAQSLEMGITELADSISGQTGTAEGRQIVEDWVASHPIQDLSLTRQYPRELIERLEGGGRLGALAAVESLEEHVAIYSQLLPLLWELVPKQVRWEAELLLQDYISREEILKAQEDLDEISKALQRAHQELDQLPTILGEQRDAVLEAARSEIANITAVIDQQRSVLTESIDTQRIETLDAVRQEREIVLDAVQQEREIVLGALRQEREVVLAAIDEQRVATLNELPKLVSESVEQANPALRAAIDYLFWRAALLFGALGVMATLAAFLIMRLGRDRQPVAMSQRME